MTQTTPAVKQSLSTEVERLPYQHGPQTAIDRILQKLSGMGLPG